MKALKPMYKLALNLAAFACVACTCLSVVFVLTEEKINGMEETKTMTGLRELFPHATEFVTLKTEDFPLPTVGGDNGLRYTGFQILSAYEALIKKGRIGIALKVRGPSYAGSIEALVGVGNDRTIIRVKITQNKETPGMGQRASYPGFIGQFENKSIADAFQAKEGSRDVDAISGATATSRAVANIVKGAGLSVATYMDAELAKIGGWK